MGKSKAKKAAAKKAAAPSGAERAHALFQMSAAELVAEGKRGFFTEADAAGVTASPVLLEAWVGRLTRAIEGGEDSDSGNDEAAGAAMVEVLGQLGSSLLALYTPQAIADTNVPATLAKHVKGFARRRTTTGPAVVTAVLAVLTDLLEDSDLGTQWFPKLKDPLFTLMCKDDNDMVVMKMRRHAADCFVAGALHTRENKGMVDHDRVVDLFTNVHDLPMKETLVILIRKCIMNVALPSVAERAARTKLRGQIPTEALYKQLLHSGRSDFGGMEFAIAYNEAVGARFLTLCCDKVTIDGVAHAARDYEQSLSDSKAIHIYAHPTYLTFQVPDASAWVDVHHTSIASADYKASAHTVTVKLTNGSEMAFVAHDAIDAKAWYRSLSRALKGHPADFPPAAAAAPATRAALPAATKDSSPLRFNFDTNSTAVDAAKAPLPPANGAGGTKRAASQAWLFDGADATSPSPSRRVLGGGGASKRARREHSTLPVPGRLRVSVDREVAAGGDAVPELRPLGTKWVPPESLLMGSSWMDDESSDDDDEKQLDHLKRTFAESMKESDTSDPTCQEDLYELQRAVQDTVDSTKRTRLDAEREDFIEAVLELKEEARAEVDKVPAARAREKALTTEVQQVHKECVHKGRHATKEVAAVLGQIDDMAAHNHEMNEQIVRAINTLMAKGFDVLKRKVCVTFHGVHAFGISARAHTHLRTHCRKRRSRRRLRPS